MSVTFPDNFSIDAWYRGGRLIKVSEQTDDYTLMTNGDKFVRQGNDIYLNKHLLTNMPGISPEDLAHIYKYSLRKKGYKIFESVNKNIYYHCSNNKFNEFDLHDNKTYKEFDIASWFFTQNLDYAKQFGKYVYECQLNIKKTFDTHRQSHYNMFMNYLHEQYKNQEQIETILDEQTYNNRPYWTCADAFYCAKNYNFDSLIIEEELEKSIESIAVFDTQNIKILKVYI